MQLSPSSYGVSSLSTQCVLCPLDNKPFTVHTQAVARSLLRRLLAALEMVCLFTGSAQARACRTKEIKRDLREELGSIRMFLGPKSVARPPGTSYMWS